MASVLASIHIGPWKTGTSAFQQILLTTPSTLRDLGFYVPPGHFFIEAHHEVPAWLTGELSKLMCLSGFTPLDPSLDGLSRYLGSLVNQARGMNAHTLVLTSEDFARLDSESWTWLAANLKSSGVSSIRVTWAPFSPDERLLSYVNQYVRQGEHIAESELEGLRSFLTSLVPEIRQRLDELSRTADVDVRAVNYSRSPLYMGEVLASVLNAEASRALVDQHRTSANESLKAVCLERLNRFNRSNVEGRAFDRSCPVIFSQEHPHQRERLQMYTELLLEVGRLTSQLDEMRQTAGVRSELEAVYASRTWRMFAWWRTLRG